MRLAQSMKPHPPYTDQQWEADYRAEQLGHALACPDCRSDVWYHAIHRIVEGARFRYRMCKRCGFWQAADGHSDPVRCWLSVHVCGNQEEIGHALMPEDTGNTCEICREYYDRSSERPWPEKGSG